jgi:LCP family protein required for cell wall assembly
MDQGNRKQKSIDGFYQKPSSVTPRKHLDLAQIKSRPQPVTPKPTPPVKALQSKDRDTTQYLNRQFTPKDLRPKVQKKRFSRKRKVVTTCLVVIALGLSVGGWYGDRLLASVNKVFHGNVISDAQALVSTSTLTGESSGRINILLAGDSADDPGHAGADLTDSIMVISIDLNNHTGFMLSVPRDLLVNIPGYGDQKINYANTVTDFSASGLPSGGMGQLQQIVQTDLGIPIDYYGLIDYTAFRDAVNAVGGVTVNIQSSDPRGLYDAYTHLKLPNGEDALTGQEALNLARARGDDVSGDVSYGFPDSDFTRTMHQRQLLSALAQKATTVGVLADPLKISGLFSAFGNNIQTNLNIQDALTLVKLTKGMNISNLQSLTYSESGTDALIMPYTDPSSGSESLIPTEGIDNFSQIQQYYQQLTSSNPIVRESPSVEILNASDVIGLARKEEAILQAKGFNVVGVADANNEYPGTMIVNNVTNQKPNSLTQLQKSFKGQTVSPSSTSQEAGEASGYTTDFVVILGKNWDPPVTTSTQE